jgi:hypothetical protein
MLATLAMSVLLFGPKGQGAQDSSKALIGKMLQYYADAQTLTGSITLTASDGKGQAQLLTQIQFEKPSKLYIRQAKGGTKPAVWLVTSDAKNFSYDYPDFLPGTQTTRLLESIRQVVPNQFVKGPDGKDQPKYANYDVRQIYATAAASIGDRSVPLDIAIGRSEDLRHDVLTWMTVHANGKVSVNGVEGNSITGKWREYGDQDQTRGEYELVITDDAKLLRYTIVQNMGTGPTSYVQLRQTWDVDLTVNGKPDPSLFKVVH